MLVIIDKYIPFLRGILEPYCEVKYLEPDEITADSVSDADALLVRSRTRCDAALLEGSKVRFIATATIGYDHIDTAYCESHGIFWTNCPGCNAQGVCDYVEEAIRTTPAASVKKSPVMGIVGVGHVGSLVAEMAERRGCRVLLNDPPKGIGVPLEQIAREADIITFHTPLTKDGAYPTYHLCDEHFLSLCKKNAVIINAARGGVIDEEAALLPENRGKIFVIDTWEGEPDINKRLLDAAEIATCHIAGYTLQGKVNATNMCLSALCKHFSLPELQVPAETLPTPRHAGQYWLLEVDHKLRQNPEYFEYLRETYPLR